MKHFLYITFLFSIIFLSCEDDSSDFVFEASDGQAGSLARFISLNNRLYIIDDENLSIFNNSDPSELSFIRTTYLGPGVETIFPYENLLFFGTSTGMLIYDNSDPDNPQFISRYEHVEACDPVAVKDNYAYLTLRSNSFLGELNPCFRGVSELQVIDVSELQNPFIVNSWTLPNPIGLSITGDDLFVCDNVGGMTQFDITETPWINFQENFTDILGHDLIIKDDLMMVVSSDKLQQYKITENGLEELGQILM